MNISQTQSAALLAVIEALGAHGELATSLGESLVSHGVDLRILVADALGNPERARPEPNPAPAADGE